jgi:hypothetical protein
MGDPYESSHPATPKSTNAAPKHSNGTATTTEATSRRPVVTTIITLQSEHGFLQELVLVLIPQFLDSLFGRGVVEARDCISLLTFYCGYMEGDEGCVYQQLRR